MRFGYINRNRRHLVSWSGGNSLNAAIDTFTTLGTYFVTVTDANGCSATDTTLVTVNATVIPSVSIFVLGGGTTICAGANVMFTATPANGGVSPTFQWFKNGIPVGTNAPDYSDNALNNNDTITLQLTSSATCATPATVTSNSIIMTVNPLPTINPSNNSPFCAGTLNLYLLPGGSAASYLWTGPNGFTSSNGTASIPGAGVNNNGLYNLVVTDANGCTAAGNTNVTIYPSPIAGIPATASGCSQVTLTASDTSSMGALACTGFNADVIANGSNTTSAATTNTDIDGSGFIVVSQDFNPGGSAFCAPGADGMPVSRTITSTQGTGITYTLQDYSSNNDLKVFGGNSNTLTLSTPTIASTLYVVCTGGGGYLTFTPTVNYQDGSYSTLADVSVSDWCSGGPNQLTGQAYYREQIGSFTDCEGYDCLHLYEIPLTGVSTSSPVVSVTFTNHSFSSYPILNIFALGYSSQTSPATYAWSGGNSTGYAANSFTSSGTYTLTVTNGQGCSTTASTVVTIDSPTDTITAGGPITFCPGDSVSLDAGSYSQYVWSNGSSAEQIIADTSAMYSVTVTDVNGCTGSASILTGLYPAPYVAITGDTGFCAGSYTILDAGSGGSLYQWSNGDFTETTNISTAGVYSVTVTGNNGCSTSASQTVTVNPNPTPSISPQGPINICNGSSVNLDAGSYSSYTWSDNSTNETDPVTVAGNYSVTVTDVNGCTGTSAPVAVTVDAPSIAALATIIPNCYGQSFSFNVTGTGGIPPYTGTGIVSAPGFSAPDSSFTFNITDSLGCGADSSITVNQPTPLVPDSGTIVNINCYGYSTGQINLNPPLGGAPFTNIHAFPTGYAYNLVGPDSVYYSVTGVFPGLPAGNYFATAIDSLGCGISNANGLNFTVSAPSQPLAAVVPGDSVIICLDNNDSTGNVMLSITGGTPPYAITGADTSNLRPGFYSYVIADANGCSVAVNNVAVVNVKNCILPYYVPPDSGKIDSAIGPELTQLVAHPDSIGDTVHNAIFQTAFGNVLY